jgi:hypothetical protein
MRPSALPSRSATAAKLTAAVPPLLKGAVAEKFGTESWCRCRLDQGEKAVTGFDPTDGLLDAGGVNVAHQGSGGMTPTVSSTLPFKSSVRIGTLGKRVKVLGVGDGLFDTVYPIA